jgi:UDP-galactopyranose mutase
MKPYDYLIVGSGLYGATFAYQAKKAGKRCLVIDKRPNAGGNVYCEHIAGINVHKYGAHIFHTSNDAVWKFVNSFAPFNRYTNCPVANYHGKLFNLPFNMNTFYQMWGVTSPEEALEMIQGQRAKARAALVRAGVEEPRNLEEQALLLVGHDIFEKLIKGYTEKQWGRRCCDLPAFIIRRLPVRFVFDNNYFNDKYQGLPEGGYNKLIAGLLQGIEVRLEADFFEDRGYWEGLADHLVFTGKIDEFYNYRFGKLSYRSLRFETEILDMPNYQGNAVINYTDRKTPFTRIIEHKHFESFGQAVYENPLTVISREYPAEWRDGMDPFYPVNDVRNSEIYQRYQALAQTDPNVIFGGRLAEYKYYDMAPVIERALSASAFLQ